MNIEDVALKLFIQMAGEEWFSWDENHPRLDEHIDRCFAIARKFVSHAAAPPPAPATEVTQDRKDEPFQPRAGFKYLTHAEAVKPQPLAPFRVVTPQDLKIEELAGMVEDLAQKVEHCVEGYCGTPVIGSDRYICLCLCEKCKAVHKEKVTAALKREESGCA